MTRTHKSAEIFEQLTLGTRVRCRPACHTPASLDVSALRAIIHRGCSVKKERYPIRWHWHTSPRGSPHCPPHTKSHLFLVFFPFNSLSNRFWVAFCGFFVAPFLLFSIVSLFADPLRGFFFDFSFGQPAISRRFARYLPLLFVFISFRLLCSNTNVYSLIFIAFSKQNCGN